MIKRKQQKEKHININIHRKRFEHIFVWIKWQQERLSSSLCMLLTAKWTNPTKYTRREKTNRNEHQLKDKWMENKDSFTYFYNELLLSFDFILHLIHFEEYLNLATSKTKLRFIFFFSFFFFDSFIQLLT